jgi:FMN-dependent oxidoreductase (nitrilotriacetate monooxygenase family)
MPTATRKMKLMAYVKTGPTATHNGAWKHPASELSDIFMPERYEHLAKVLEAGFFDGCFFADTLGLPDIYKGSFDTYLHYGGQLSYLDPVTVLPIMARVTKHLGLGATLSTTFHHPYHLARLLASIDHLSAGRACWNVVTSTTDFEARNFGMKDLPAKDDRYARGDEVVEACCALWDCWEEGAMVMDKEEGLFIDPGKVRYANYKGEHVSTRGPLTIPRSPQGRPVLMQAGSSPRGREFAARWGEAIFASAADTANHVKLYTDIKSRMDKFNRPPEHCQVLAAMNVVVGETDAIAKEKADYLNSLLSPELSLATSSAMMGADITKVKDEKEFAKAAGHQGHGGSVDKVLQIMEKEKISFAEAARRPRGMVGGSPTTIADHMQEMFEAGGSDGFVLMPNLSPIMFEEFGRMVVPELQRRGLFRTTYTGKTMRENLRS